MGALRTLDLERPGIVFELHRVNGVHRNRPTKRTGRTLRDTNVLDFSFPIRESNCQSPPTLAATLFRSIVTSAHVS